MAHESTSNARLSRVSNGFRMVLNGFLSEFSLGVFPTSSFRKTLSPSNVAMVHLVNRECLSSGQTVSLLPVETLYPSVSVERRCRATLSRLWIPESLSGRLSIRASPSASDTVLIKPVPSS